MCNEPDHHGTASSKASSVLKAGLLISLLLSSSAMAAALSDGSLPGSSPLKSKTGIEQALEVPADKVPSDNPLGIGGQTPAVNKAPVATDATGAPVADMPEAEIIRDMSALPAPVAKLRQELITAAMTGDIEKLRPLINPGPDQMQVLNSDGDDPIDLLKNLSGDPDGQEILAIFIDLLSTGAARFEAGKPDEIYVWPYFAGKPLAKLSPPERVDLLRIVTAGDLMGMEEVGSYNFYRLGITPDGKWKFVASGD